MHYCCASPLTLNGGIIRLFPSNPVLRTEILSSALVGGRKRFSEFSQLKTKSSLQSQACLMESQAVHLYSELLSVICKQTRAAMRVLMEVMGEVIKTASKPMAAFFTY